MDNISFWHSHGLALAPFEDRASESFHCLLPQWQEAFRALHRLVVGGVYSSEHTSRLALVVGHFGTGKSVLLSQFLSQVETSVSCCLIRGNPSISFSDIGLALATRFRLAGIIDAFSQNKQASVESQIQQLLAACQQKSQPPHCLLVIDDAHRLSTDVLTGLLRLAEQQALTQSTSLSVILAGDTKLQARLSHFNSPAHPLWAFELKPLDKNNTKLYLDYRLKEAGWSGASPFDESALVRIHRLSGGIPGRINRVAEQVLIQCLTEQGRADQVSAATENHNYDDVDSVNVNDGFAQSAASSSSLPSSPVAPAPCSPAVAATAPQLSHNVSITDQCFNQLYLKVCGGFQAVYARTIKKQPIILLSISFLFLVGMTFSVAKQFTTPTFSLLWSALFNDNVVQQFNQLNDVGLDSEMALLSMYPHYHYSTTPDMVLADLPTIKTVSLKPMPEKNVSALPADEQTALVNRKQGYAVQLMAMPNREPLIHFLKTAHWYAAYKASMGDFDRPSPHIFKGISQHHAFYGLVYGPFASWGEAGAWLNRQPKAIQALHPWIRSMRSIGDAIQATQTTE